MLLIDLTSHEINSKPDIEGVVDSNHRFQREVVALQSCQSHHKVCTHGETDTNYLSTRSCFALHQVQVLLKLLCPGQICELCRRVLGIGDTSVVKDCDFKASAK